MKRRTILLAGAMLAAPQLLLAQTSRVYRLGWLFTTDEATTKPLVDAFLARMRELGYVVGRNLVNDFRWARGDASRYPVLADELIALKPDILLGIQEAALALAAKTSAIPIVLLASADPVAAGLVKNLARPGTNVTGMAGLYEQLVAKQIELLTEIGPNISKVAMLWDSSSFTATREQMERMARDAGTAKGVTVIAAAARDLEGLRAAFAEFRKQRADAVVVAPTGTMTFFRREIAGEALRLRLPTISGMSQFADGGGLINYSPGFPQSFRDEIPAFVDRILRGVKPAELPVQQVTKYELVVNLKTARALGIEIPRSVMLRADRVIE